MSIHTNVIYRVIHTYMILVLNCFIAFLSNSHILSSTHFVIINVIILILSFHLQDFFNIIFLLFYFLVSAKSSFDIYCAFDVDYKIFQSVSFSLSRFSIHLNSWRFYCLISNQSQQILSLQHLHCEESSRSHVSCHDTFLRHVE